MATIPEFQRRQLASSAVGTPGVDTSGQKIGESVAQVADVVAREATSIVVRRREAVNKAAAFNSALTFENQLIEFEKQHRKDNAGFIRTPDEPDRSDVFRDRGTALKDAGAKLLPAGARAEYLEKAGTFLNRRFQDEVKFASENEVVIAGALRTESQNKLSFGVSSTFRDTSLTYAQKLAELEVREAERSKNVNDAIPLFGTEESNKFNTLSRQGLVTAAFLGLMESSPADAVKFAKDPHVREIMGEEENTKRLDQAENRALDFKDRIKKRQFAQTMETNAADIGKFVAGDHDLASIQNIPNKDAREFLTDAYLDANQLTAKEIAIREASLALKFTDFFVRDKKGNLTSEIKKDKSIRDVVDLQHDYMRNFSVTRGEGQLERSAKNYPDMLGEVIRNQQPGWKLKALIGFLNSIPGGTLVTGLKTGLKTSQQKDEDRARMADMFISNLAKVNPNNTAELDTAVQVTLNAFQLEKDPRMSKYKVGETYSMAGIPMVAVRNADGSFGFDDKKK